MYAIWKYSICSCWSDNTILLFQGIPIFPAYFRIARLIIMNIISIAVCNVLPNYILNRNEKTFIIINKCIVCNTLYIKDDASTKLDEKCRCGINKSLYICHTIILTKEISFMISVDGHFSIKQLSKSIRGRNNYNLILKTNFMFFHHAATKHDNGNGNTVYQDSVKWTSNISIC